MKTLTELTRDELLALIVKLYFIVVLFRSYHTTKVLSILDQAMSNLHKLDDETVDMLEREVIGSA